MLSFKKIFKNTSHVIFGNVTSSIFGFLSLALVVRLLSKHEYGQIILALSIMVFLNLFLDFGLGELVVAEVARRQKEDLKTESKYILNIYSKMQLITSVIIFIGVVVAGRFFLDGNISRLLQISSFMIITEGLKNIYVSIFDSHSDFFASSTLWGLQSFYRFICVLLIGMVFKFGFLGIMFCYPLANLLSIMTMTPAYMRLLKGYKEISSAKDKNLFLMLLKRGKWTSVSFAIKQFRDNLLVWIPAYFLGMEAVAIFNLANRAFSYFSIILYSFEKILMTMVPQNFSDENRFKNLLKYSFKYTVWLAVPAVVLMYFVSPCIFRLVFTEKYINSITVFRLLLPISVLLAMTIFSRPLFFSLAMQKEMSFAFIVELIVMLISLLAFTKSMGVNGIALACILNGASSVIVRNMFLARKGIKFNYLDILKFDERDDQNFSKIFSFSKIKGIFWGKEVKENE